ncbi:SDR family NAD(P)-dependent oxidoreductase [Streptomyces sulphureus]|uniref:SDR family NAD(P)-dependent oxidoreductase n=1 Tax=Streptomyces sulphureus TaxID=47758 RepID=UPI001B7F7EA6|nr:SDR family NAD(P)-dependent oxidoreductase [Streptomyces sulphureus]
MAGRVAVVTGAASGIGFALARELQAAGAEVVLADIEQRALDAASADLGLQGVRVDVSRYEDVQRLGDAVMARHGRVDLVVNNAGVARLAPFEQLSLDDFAWVLGVNLWGVVNGMKVFLPLLERTSQDGFLVNTASIAGFRNGPGLGAYAMSKSGVVALTETVAQELAERGSGVGVGVLAPARVTSRIATSARNRPGVPAGPVPKAQTPPVPGELTAAEAARRALAGICRRELYLVTHPEALASLQQRQRRIEAAFEAAGA